MGKDMELDLVAGHTAPKSALTKGTAQKKRGAPNSAAPAFATLMHDKLKKEDSDSTAIPELAVPLPVIAAKTAPAHAGSDKKSKHIIGGIFEKKAPATKDISAPVKSEAQTGPILPPLAAHHQPDTHTRPPLTAASKPTTPLANESVDKANPAIISKPAVTIDPKSTKLKIRKGAPNTPDFAKTPTDRPTLVHKLKPAEAPQISYPVSGEKSADTAPLGRDKTHPLAPVALTKKPALKAKAASKPSPHPKVELATDDSASPSENGLQIGIKIEQPSLVLTHASRPVSHTAPVASQISAQLPQLLSKAEKQTVELRLDPPELGRVTIHLRTKDQHITAHVVAERSDTADLMRRNADIFTATLARAGFSQADLSFQQGKSQNGAGEHQQIQTFNSFSESDEPARPSITTSGLDGRLDIRL